MSAKKHLPLGPIIVGLGGFAVLISLGLWQLERLQWKNSIIAEAEKRLEVAPTALPAAPDVVKHDYKRVFVQGRYDHTKEQYVLTSLPPHGPGFDVITPFETAEGRRILVDRGYVPQAQRAPETRTSTTETGIVRIEGVLRWPQDTSIFTPAPNAAKREWYSREVPPLAAALSTEPVMVVQGPLARSEWPRGSKAQLNIRNHHLPYAIQWFAIAAIWLVMTFLWGRKVALPPTAQ